MNRLGHLGGAIAFSPVVIAPIQDSPTLVIVAMMALIAGAGAPDWLEFKIIPHRTYTHILSVWLLGAHYGLCSAIGMDLPLEQPPALIGAIVWGFCCGGVAHWIGDVLNMRAIPVITPFDKIALRLFNSGKHQPFSCLFIFLVGLAIIKVAALFWV